MMMCLFKWISATLAIALLAGTVAAADTVSAGKIKSIDAASKTFAVTDSANKDFTFKIGDHLVINRDGKESKTDLKAGDDINVCYDKGLLTWTVHYVLVQEGKTKNCSLMAGAIKNYDAGKKELAFTDEDAKTTTFSMGEARVRINMKDSKVEDIKIGDHARILVEMVERAPILRSVMVDRK
jgi:hypothetical protein